MLVRSLVQCIHITRLRLVHPRSRQSPYRSEHNKNIFLTPHSGDGIVNFSVTLWEHRNCQRFSSRDAQRQSFAIASFQQGSTPGSAPARPWLVMDRWLRPSPLTACPSFPPSSERGPISGLRCRPPTTGAKLGEPRPTRARTEGFRPSLQLNMASDDRDARLLGPRLRRARLDHLQNR